MFVVVGPFGERRVVHHKLEGLPVLVGRLLRVDHRHHALEAVAVRPTARRQATCRPAASPRARRASWPLARPPWYTTPACGHSRARARRQTSPSPRTRRVSSFRRARPSARDRPRFIGRPAQSASVAARLPVAFVPVELVRHLAAPAAQRAAASGRPSARASRPQHVWRQARNEAAGRRGARRRAAKVAEAIVVAAGVAAAPLGAATGATTGAGAGASSTSVSSPESESLLSCARLRGESAGICWKVATLVVPLTVSPSHSIIGGSPGPILVDTYGPALDALLTTTEPLSTRSTASPLSSCTLPSAPSRPMSERETRGLMAWRLSTLMKQGPSDGILSS